MICLENSSHWMTKLIRFVQHNFFPCSYVYLDIRKKRIRFQFLLTVNLRTSHYYILYEKLFYVQSISFLLLQSITIVQGSYCSQKMDLKIYILLYRKLNFFILTAILKYFTKIFLNFITNSKPDVFIDVEKLYRQSYIVTMQSERISC